MTTSATLLLLAATILPPLAISLLAGYAIRRLAPRWGLVDRPGPRKVHTQPTPLGGGIAIWLGVVLTFFCGQIVLWLASSGEPFAALVPEFALPHLAGLREKSGQLWGLLGCGTVLLLLGLADDRKGIDWRARLLVQIAVASICVWVFEWRLSLFVELPALTGILSVLWIVSLVNSFNMLDNMDGLSAGVATIAALSLAGVMLLAPNPEGSGPQFFIAGFLFVLAGGMLGLLWHNRPPAKLFMGDAGSYFIGFCLAIATLLATFTGQAESSRHMILAPLLVMAVPLYDMLSVIGIRLRQGRSPFAADQSHFSHRLVQLGLSKRHAVLTIYLVTAVCGLAALLLHRTDFIGGVLLAVLVLMMLAIVGVLESTGRVRNKP